MFDIGVPELILILVVALLLFGAERVPEVAKSLGKSIKAFKDGMREGLEDEEAPRAKDAKLAAASAEPKKLEDRKG